MNDEESRVDPRAIAPREQYGESLLYDFSKFLTTLSLLALGGVLTLTESADRADIKPFNIALILILITAAGILALTAANNLVIARASGDEPHKGLRLQVRIAMAALGMGTGVFLAMWWDKLT
jgi:hypothetical protein